jgi:hypothetical protein
MVVLTHAAAYFRGIRYCTVAAQLSHLNPELVLPQWLANSAIRDMGIQDLLKLSGPFLSHSGSSMLCLSRVLHLKLDLGIQMASDLDVY